MPTNVFDANGGTKLWSAAGNWSLGHKPAAGEDIVVDGTGSAICGLDEDTASLLSLTISGDGDFAGNTWTISVAGDCHVTSTGSIDFGTSTVDLTATGDLSNPTAANTFYTLILAPASGTTTLTDDVYTRTVELGDGILTQATTGDDMFLGTGLTVGGGLKVVTATALSAVDNSGGGADLDFIFGMTSGTYTIDGFDGDLALDLQPVSTSSATIQVVTRAIEAERLDMGASSATFDFNGQDGMIASVDSGTAGASSILCGEGTLDFGLWVSDNADGTINLEGATIQMGGQFSMRVAGMALTNGTSTMNFDDGSGTNEIELQGESLDTVNFTGAATWNLQDDFTCGALTLNGSTLDTNDGAIDWNIFCTNYTQTVGTFTPNSSTISISGNCLINGGTLTNGTSTFDLTGTGTVINGSTARAFWILKCAANTKTTTLSGNVLTERVEFGTGVLTASGAYRVQFWLPASGKILTNAGVTVNASGGTNPELYFGATGAGISGTFDGINMGTGAINFQGGTSATFTALGTPITSGGITVRNDGNGSTLDLDTFGLTCGSLTLGAAANANVCTLLCGSSGTVDCTSFSTLAGATGAIHLNMEGCTFECSGDFAINHANHTLTGGTSTLDLDGAGTQDITLSGESLNDVDVTGSSTVEMQDAFVAANFTLTTGTFDTNSVGDYAMTVTTLDMNGGTFNANGSAIGVGGDCTIDGGSADFGTSTVTLTASGNLSNTTEANRFANFVQGDSITTTMVGTTWIGTSTAMGVGSTFQTDGATRILVIRGGALTVNTVTWSSNGGELRIDFRTAGAATFPGDDYGDATIYIRRNGATTTFGGDVTTTSLVKIFSKDNNQTCFVSSGGYNLVCGVLEVGLSGDPLQGGSISFTGTSTIIVNGNATVYADNGTQINRIAWAAGNSGTSTITGALVVGALAELDWVSACTHVLQLGGDVTFDSTASIEEDAGTIVLNGSGAQAIDFGSNAVNNVTVTNTSGTVSFTTAPTINGTFAPGNGGSTVTIRFPTSGTTHWEAVDTSAASGTGTIDINSIGESASWALTIGSNQTVTSVDVTYSNLGGFTIDATDATNVDGGNNSVNWNFGAPPTGNVPQKMNSYRRRRT